MITLKNKYGNNSRLSFTKTDNFNDTKTENVYDDLAMIRKCFTLVIVSLNQNIMTIETK